MFAQGFNDKLIKVKADLEHRARLQEMVAMADGMIAERYVKLEKLKRILIKERCDVEKLEGLTVERLLHYLVIGTSTARLENEQKELLIAQQNYEHCLALTKALEEDRAEVEEAVNELEVSLFECEEEVERARLLWRSAIESIE